MNFADCVPESERVFDIGLIYFNVEGVSSVEIVVMRNSAPLVLTTTVIFTIQCIIRMSVFKSGYIIDM